MNRFFTVFVAASLSTALLAGFAKDTAGKLTKPPPLPPPVPTVQKVPVSDALRESAKHELILGTSSADPYLRCNSIEGIHLTLGDEGQPYLLHGLSDPEPVVRFAACLACGQAQIAQAHEPLLAMLRDSDLSVEVGVRFALHKLGDKRFSHDLEHFAGDVQISVRANTAMVFGLLGEPSATKILQQMMSDPAASVHLSASESLWRLGSEQGLENLVAESISANPADQIIAVLALAAPKDQRVIEHVRGMLTTDYVEVNLAAARAMGMLASDEGYGVAVIGAKSKDPRQRALAALAFGAIGRTDAQTILAPLLSDESQGVRIAAATAVRELK